MVNAPDRRNAIGALRLVLAGLVLYSHAYMLGGFGSEWLADWSRGTIGAGTVAVQGFFALSGWLVATSWRRQPHLGRYLWHRFLRIAPALWVCLVVTAFVFTPLLWWLSPGPRTPFFTLEPSAFGYLWHNLFLPRTQLAIGPYPSGGPWTGDWNGSLWTLFYEGAAYLIAAGLGLCGLLNRWRQTGTLLIAGFLLLHVVAALFPSLLPGRILRLYDTPGKVLTLHFLAGAAWAAWPEATAALLRRWWLALGAAALLVLSWPTLIHPWLSPFVLAPSLIWAAWNLPLRDIESWAGGDYSYGLYLYGYPVQQMLAEFQVHHLGFAPYLAASISISFLLAVASWHLCEKRALALKSVIRGSRP